jgi:hypothetical protein
MGTQFLQEADIGGGKFVPVQFLPCDPFQGFAIYRSGFVALATAKEKLQVDGPFRVMVGERFHQIADFRLDSQFLCQFANQALLEGLVRLAFSAGEFPQASQVRTRLPLGDEELASAEDQTGRHLDHQAFPRPMLL